MTHFRHEIHLHSLKTKEIRMDKIALLEKEQKNFLMYLSISDFLNNFLTLSIWRSEEPYPISEKTNMIFVYKQIGIHIHVYMYTN
jgi:hypothetical protein